MVLTGSVVGWFLRRTSSVPLPRRWTEAMRFTFSDIDQRHVRQYLADTAIHVYGLDRPKLEAVAAEIGPTVEEIATPYSPGHDEALGLYAFRTGPGIFA